MALTKVTSNVLNDNAVTTTKIVDLNVTTTKIAGDAITNELHINKIFIQKYFKLISFWN